MPTPAAETGHPSVGAAAKQVAEHASTLAKLELELAGLELKQKAGLFGAGVGLGVGAAVVALYGLGFLFATAAVALAIVLDAWLALLIVTAEPLRRCGAARAACQEPDQAGDAARPRTGHPRGEADDRSAEVEWPPLA